MATIGGRKWVPSAEEIRAMEPEEKESLKKDYFRKIHEDFPGLDYLMISAAIDQFLAEPEMTPDDILKHYNPQIWEKKEEDVKKVEAAMETLPDEGRVAKDPMANELMHALRQRNERANAEERDNLKKKQQEEIDKEEEGSSGEESE